MGIDIATIFIVLLLNSLALTKYVVNHSVDVYSIISGSAGIIHVTIQNVIRKLGTSRYSSLNLNMQEQLRQLHGKIQCT